MYIHSFVNMPAKYPYDDDPIKVPRFHESGGFYTNKQRSKTMSKIKGKDTKPELLLRKALWANNLRFRIHVKDLPGKPDLAIKKYKLAVFVDGEFWHGKDWAVRKHHIKSNKEFWIPKIERNMQIDRINRMRLEEMGYVVMRFWDKEVKENTKAIVDQILLYLETAKEINIPYREE